MPCSAQKLFDWHNSRAAFEKLSPPWETVQIVKGPTILEPGMRVEVRIRIAGFMQTWVSEVTDVAPGRGFVDVQASGPWAYWRHIHRFDPVSESKCILRDAVEYALPFSPISELIAGRYVEKRMQRLFDYRHKVTLNEMRKD